MKKLILFIMLTLFLIFLFSCQIADLLFSGSQDIKYNSNDFSLQLTYNLPIPERGNKITSFELGNILLISYIDINYGQINFKYKKLNEENLNNQTFGDILDNTYKSFFLSTGFDFSNPTHPYSYIPVFDKLDENSIDFYFLDSTYYLQKRKLKLFYDFNYNSYNFSINDSQTSSYPVDSDFPQDNNAILYNLKKSGKIGYMSFYNNTVYIVSWGKEDLTNFNRINFSIPDYNLTQNLYSTMVEYDTNKIYVASIALNNSDGEYYLIIYSVDLESGDYNKLYELYESKDEGKKTFYSTIKMSYIEEKNKLYIAWGYSKDGKDYVSISEFDFKTKKLVDRLKIDISGKYLVDIDIKRLFASGISGSNFFIVYLVNDISGNQYNVGYVKTDDFSDSNWSYNIIKGFTSELIFSNFADSSSYLFINLSRYDNSVPQLSYNLSLIY